jgi:hypothetical protein
MMRRDKNRFTLLFRRRLWWQLYYDEFHDYRRNYHEDGYAQHDTRKEYEAAFRRQSRKATRYANEVCGSRP